MNEKNEFGNYIKKWRGNHSIREAANLAGISHSYWSDLERGYSRASGKPVKPSIEIISKVADVLLEFNASNMDDPVKVAFLFDLMDLSGYSSARKNIEGQRNNEYTFLRSHPENSSLLEIDAFNYPINDISFHLTKDNLNKKFYEGVPLSRTQLNKLDSVIELFLTSTFRLSMETCKKLIDLVGKRDIDELENVYNILKFAYSNKEYIVSFDDLVSHAILKELNLEWIDTGYAYEIAYELFNDSKE